MPPNIPIQDVSEGNKENLPLWLVEASTPLWDSGQTEFYISSNGVTVRTRPPAEPKRTATLQKNDPELADALSRLSMYGRGGTPHASTVPNTRPRQRSKLPDRFTASAFDVYEDPGERAGDKPEWEPVPLSPGVMELLKSSDRVPEIATPVRGRAATFPGIRGGSIDSSGNYERVSKPPTVSPRIALSPIVDSPPPGTLKLKPGIMERRCISWGGLSHSKSSPSKALLDLRGPQE
ncbi:hypothetical protein L873DRAFT_1808760 [Choiromyces venosus 120613-1]|uniref:Uncharacterized protein n=1 Tax=Choiromyces venosus 120613-1 TaxID=1336337 RepID=A0A3N4JLJ2_9PEZI|nr:hypothetical protein L873DRAFT_1808760 [Choiromyces venosus 120613-1]